MRAGLRACGRVGRAVAGLLAAGVLLVQAAPAPWFRWRSLTTEAVVCRQVSPGEGWELAAGPYRDAQCTKAYPR